MTPMSRVSLLAFHVAMVAAIGTAACSSENEPATNPGNKGGSSSSASGGTSPASGGTSSASGGTSSANGGSTSTANGGTSSANGGSASASGGTSASSGGSSGATGGGPAAGGGQSGGAPGANEFTPACVGLKTAAGLEPQKATACTAADPQRCYRTCGPQSVGWKPEDCTAGAYVEGDCAFPAAGDYSCFAVPTTINAAACGAAMPQASKPCTVAECTLCNLDGSYLDSAGSAKVGYCICQPAKADGSRTWSCASATAWPCPSGNGC